MDENCNKAEGLRLLETMRRVCNATGCKEVEQATLAYEEKLQESIYAGSDVRRQSNEII